MRFKLVVLLALLWGMFAPWTFVQAQNLPHLEQKRKTNLQQIQRIRAIKQQIIHQEKKRHL